MVMTLKTMSVNGPSCSSLAQILQIKVLYETCKVWFTVTERPLLNLLTDCMASNLTVVWVASAASCRPRCSLNLSAKLEKSACRQCKHFEKTSNRFSNMIKTQISLLTVTGGWVLTTTALDLLCLGLFQKLSSGVGGLQTPFCPVGRGCFVDNVSEGWGGNLSWGSRCIWSIVGQVNLIKALTCPGGRGALTPCVSWGWRGLKKNVGPLEDNFWNSP